jgi:spore coat polysaccharide biosynthesis protein SpsF
MKLGKVGVIVAARTQSSRLPGKALMPLQGRPMILFLLSRLAGMKKADVVLATTDLVSDDNLAVIVEAAGVPVFRGSESDVVARYCAAAEVFNFDTVVRVTGDCPLVDADLIDGCLAQCETFENFDLASTKGVFPIGLDAEIYPAKVMAALNIGGRLSAEDREHLTLHMYRNAGFTVRKIQTPIGWKPVDRSFTVDTRADYDSMVLLVQRFSTEDFSVHSIMADFAA